MTLLSVSLVAHVLLLLLYTGILSLALVRKSSFGIGLALSLIMLDTMWNLSIGGWDNVLHVGTDLMGIGLISLFFVWCKEHYVKFLVILSGIVGLSWVHGTEHMAWSNGHLEETQLLIQFKTKSDLEHWISEYDRPEQVTYPAFEPEDDSFLLDEYIALDYRGNDVKEFMSKLESSKIIDHVEFNEQITVAPISAAEAQVAPYKSSLNDPYVSKQRMKGPYDLDDFHKLADKHKANANEGPVVIAILDTGVDSRHEDLKANYISTASRYDSDKKGHGTHCAGIAAAVTGNKIGIASLVPKGADIKVTSIKVLGDMGVGTQKTIIRGIIIAADKGYDVISMSLGSVSSDSKQKAYNEAVKYAKSKGCIVVAAAGNSNRDAANYSPANSKGVIAVSAVDSVLRKAKFANDISNIEQGIYAPGTMVFSTFPGDEYKSFNGTSMAAPLVSGLIAVMKSYKRNLTAEEAYNIINESALTQKGIKIMDPISTMKFFFAKTSKVDQESGQEWSPSQWQYQ